MENKEAIERAKSIAAKLESKNQGILLASFDTSLQDNFLYCTTQSINQSIISLSLQVQQSHPQSHRKDREKMAPAEVAVAVAVAVAVVGVVAARLLLKKCMSQ